MVQRFCSIIAVFTLWTSHGVIVIGSLYHGMPGDIYFGSGDALHIEKFVNDRQEFSPKLV